MAVRKILRAPAGSAQDIPTAGPNWNSIRVDSTTNQLVVGTGTSGSAEAVAGGIVTIIPSAAATVAITAAQTGSTFLFDRAGGVVYTLPAITVGLWYNLYTTVSLTQGAYEVATNNETTDFIVGSIMTGIGASATTVMSIANGTTHVEISSNDTTTGGLAGGAFTMTAVTATQWFIEGFLVGSGSIATPFST